MSSIKELQATADTLEQQLAALRNEHNAAAAEYQRLHTSGGKQKQLDALAKKGAVLTRQMQMIANERDAAINELGPARSTLRVARDNVAYLETDAAARNLGAQQVYHEVRRLKTIIAELEA